MIAPVNSDAAFVVTVPKYHVVVAIGCDPRERGRPEDHPVRAVLLNLNSNLVTVCDVMAHDAYHQKLQPYPAFRDHRWTACAGVRGDASHGLLRYGTSDSVWAAPAVAAEGPITATAWLWSEHVLLTCAAMQTRTEYVPIT